MALTDVVVFNVVDVVVVVIFAVVEAVCGAGKLVDGDAALQRAVEHRVAGTRLDDADVADADDEPGERQPEIDEAAAVVGRMSTN